MSVAAPRLFESQSKMIVCLPCQVRRGKPVDQTRRLDFEMKKRNSRNYAIYSRDIETTAWRCFILKHSMHWTCTNGMNHDVEITCMQVCWNDQFCVDSSLRCMVSWVCFVFLAEYGLDSWMICCMDSIQMAVTSIRCLGTTTLALNSESMPFSIRLRSW